MVYIACDLPRNLVWVFMSGTRYSFNESYENNNYSNVMLYPILTTLFHKAISFKHANLRRIDSRARQIGHLAPHQPQSCRPFNLERSTHCKHVVLVSLKPTTCLFQCPFLNPHLTTYHSKYRWSRTHAMLELRTST